MPSAATFAIGAAKAHGWFSGNGLIQLALGFCRADDVRDSNGVVDRESVDVPVDFLGFGEVPLDPRLDVLAGAAGVAVSALGEVNRAELANL